MLLHTRVHLTYTKARQSSIFKLIQLKLKLKIQADHSTGAWHTHRGHNLQTMYSRCYRLPTMWPRVAELRQCFCYKFGAEDWRILSDFKLLPHRAISHTHTVGHLARERGREGERAMWMDGVWCARMGYTLNHWHSSSSNSFILCKAFVLSPSIRNEKENTFACSTLAEMHLNSNWQPNTVYWPHTACANAIDEVLSLKFLISIRDRLYSLNSNFIRDIYATSTSMPTFSF